LRELALRRVADRVDAAARASALADRSSRAWMARDRVLVAIGPDQQAEQMVRAGKRIADGLDAQWTVVYVETPNLLRLSAAERNRRVDLLRLAESLGAETVTLDGPSAAQALLEYARTRNATRLVVGAPKRRGWRAWLRPSTTTELVRHARGFDVIVIGPADHDHSSRERTPSTSESDLTVPVHWNRYAWALATSGIATAITFAMFPYFELANIVMAYVLASTIAAVRFGRGPAVLAAIVNVFAFDFCFVPPRFTFSVADVQYIVTFAVMLIVAVTIANLMASVRQQTRVAGARERRTASLYAMSRELAATRGVSNMARVAVRHVSEVFDCKAVVLLPDAKGRLHHPDEPPIERSFSNADLSIAQWVVDHGKRAGLGSDTLPAAPALYVPLSNERQRLGVLGVQPENRRRVLLPEQRHLLETFAGQLGLALERAQLADAAESTRVAAETQNLRNTLLASISHDLRTPLSVIAGASGTLAEHGRKLDEEGRTTLARCIETKAREMSDLISNVMDLMRFESGPIVLRREWETLDDLVGAALNRAAERLQAHSIDVTVSSDLPPVNVDASLIVQVLVNLLDNAAKYTQPGARIHIAARAEYDLVRVTVDDEGPGLPTSDRDRLFDKFQRGRDEGTIVGAGLGLAICRAIVRAHGGEIEAGDRPGGGARFEFTLPTTEPNV
jgi:two-component system sensor histidine kinase KdpD